MTSKLELSSNEIDGLIRLTKKRKANEPDLSNVHDFFTKRQRVELSEIERKTIFDFAHLQAGDATITKLRNVLRPKKETDLTQSDVDKILEILDERKEKDSKYKEVYDILSKKQKDGSFTVEYNEEDPNIEFLQPKGSRRYVLYDLQHSELFKYAKKLQDLHWTTNASDVDLSSDTAHFEEIKNKRPEVADVTLGVLSFFAASDGIIMENIESFTEDVSF